MELRPMPHTAGRGAKRDTLPARVVLMSADGTLPVEYVVQIPKGATRRSLLERVTELTGLDANAEQLVIMQADVSVPLSSATALPVSRLKSWVAGVHSAGGGGGYMNLDYGTFSSGDTDESLDEELPTGTRLARNFPIFVATRLPKGDFVAVHLRRAGWRTVVHKRARDVRLFGKTREVRYLSPAVL